MENQKNDMAQKKTSFENIPVTTSQPGDALPILSSADIASFKTRLEAKAKFLEASIRNLDDQSRLDSAMGSGDLNTVRTHPADQGTEMADQERNSRVADLEEIELEAVQYALRRIQEGGFGLCAECGEPIPRARLNAVPWAAMDVACQTQFESDLMPAVTRQI